MDYNFVMFLLNTASDGNRHCRLHAFNHQTSLPVADASSHQLPQLGAEPILILSRIEGIWQHRNPLLPLVEFPVIVPLDGRSRFRDLRFFFRVHVGTGTLRSRPGPFFHAMVMARTVIHAAILALCSRRIGPLHGAWLLGMARNDGRCQKQRCQRELKFLHGDFLSELN